MQGQLNSRKSWIIAIVVFICFFVIETSEQRVPPVLSLISTDMGLTVVQGGWLMSAFGWASLISALPAAWILIKLRPKLTMALAVVLPLISSVLGAFASSFAALIVARVLSGLGVGVLGVISASIIDQWFTPDKRGLPTGIMVATYPLSCFFMLNISPIAAEHWGWQGAWWISGALTLVCLVIVLALLSNENPYSETEEAKKENEQAASKVSIGKILKTPALWGVLIGFAAFDIAFYGVTTYMPSVLAETLNASMEVANLVSSLMMAILIPAAVLNGFLLGKVGIKNRKYLPAFGLAGLGIAGFVAFQVTTVGAASAAMVAAGFFAGFCSGSFFTIGPDTVPEPAAIGIVVALVTLFQNLGIAIGPLVIGTCVEAAGNVWSAAGLPTLIVGLVGAVLCLVMIRVKEPAKNNSEELAQ